MIIFEKPVHSKDVILQGLDLVEAENFLGIRPYLEHLKSIGWDSIQWRFYPDSFTIKADEKDVKPVQFVEAFGSRYKGYIRGNSRVSLLEACKSALQQAQGFARCEMTTGHDYEPYKGYSNGLMACKNCGFNGYNTLTELDQFSISHLKACLKFENAMRNEIMSNMKEWGITLKFDGQFIIDQNVYNAKLTEHKNLNE